MGTTPESAAVEAVAWDYSPEHRIAVTDGKGGVTMTLNGHDAPAGISLYHGDYVSELQSALDALRGEVRELTADRDSWRDQASERVADWDKERQRADAAERRVAELKRVCKPIIEKSIAISKTTSSVFTSDLRRFLAALTKETP